MLQVLASLTEPFERMPGARASALLLEHWGLAAESLELLDTERDDTFRVRSPEGDFVLKISHPSDDPAVIDLQIAAMGHALAGGLPVARVVPALSGRLTASFEGRVARVYSWLDGMLLREMSATSGELELLGAALGRLSLALAGFGHPASHRVLAWDLARLDSLAPFASGRSAEVISRFTSFVAPRLAGLPRQVNHNDFHPGNVLVDPDASTFITGILDFGDIVYTARVCDVALALAYLLPEEGAPHVQPFLDGFESVVPLVPAERAVLPDLVAGRLVQRLVINRALDEAADEYDPDDYSPLEAKLENYLQYLPQER